MKLGELGMICRVLALHLLTRERQQQSPWQQRSYQAHQAGQHPQPQPLPDRPTLVRRLAEELGLRSQVVGDRLEESFVAIRKQEEEAAAAAAEAADDWDSRGGGGRGGGGGPAVRLPPAQPPPPQSQPQPRPEPAQVAASIPDEEGRGGGGSRR